MLEHWREGIHDNEERCQTVTPQGQCKLKVIPNSTRCAAHGGNSVQQSLEKQSLNMYRLAKYADRVKDFKEHSEVKSLQSEIGILRVMLEEKWNACKDNMDLLLVSGPMSDLVMKIERLVSSCHKIDNQLGNLLDRQKVQVLASMLMNSVDAKIKEINLSDAEKGELLEKIAKSFMETLHEFS